MNTITFQGTAMGTELSIVLPSKNEALSLTTLLPAIRQVQPTAEIIVVNDGSSDNTTEICEKLNIIELKHPYSKGNGASIKAGAAKAQGKTILFMDADGQHKPEDIGKLLETFHSGYDMVVGARDHSSQASFGRMAANKIYNRLASFMVGHKVPDLTSGFRAVNAKKFRKFIHLLPNGFSYPTTTTMAFFRAGHSVAYTPITTNKRIGKSHISLSKDGLKFLLIIFKVGTLYSPLKMFTPISALLFGLGLLRYAYTFLNYGTFTNMTALLFSTSLIVFIIGLVSEQITMLIYQSEKNEP